MIIINDKEYTNKPSSISENVSPTIVAESHGNLPKIAIKQEHKDQNNMQICAMRGRYQHNLQDQTAKIPTEQQLEINQNKTTNTITTVQKDNLVLKQDNYEWRIRKLTPKECGRLMGVDDEDIDKIAEVNSNTQLYKQFGNSIVVDVMCYMFKNLNIEQN